MCVGVRTPEKNGRTVVPTAVLTHCKLTAFMVILANFLDCEFFSFSSFFFFWGGGGGGGGGVATAPLTKFDGFVCKVRIAYYK